MTCEPVRAASPADVDHKRLVNADKEPGNWMSWGRTYGEQRFSPLDQINDGNVDRLGLAWYRDLNTFRGVEGTPLVVDGVMYNISAWNVTSALDAKTGEEIWTYDPEVPRAWGRYACCGPVSRGLAVWKGKVYIATLDGRLIAIDAATGKPVWTVQTFDKTAPYTITGAPRVFNGKVVIGNGGADLGVRGFVTAYDAEAGDRLWRFYTVPGNPAKGFENDAMKMAAETWTGEWWTLGGGGTAWDSLVYDAELDLVYIGTGNGSPLAHKHRSPEGGDNLFLSSVVAVDAQTGEYVWHYQEVPGENWDYTATQPMMLADLKIGGKKRKVLMHAPKNGFFYVLDRKTGELISATKFVPANWASHVDLKTDRPVILPEARYGTEPVLVTPSAGGGHNWEPMSYSPETGLVYLPVQEDWQAFALDPDFEPQPFRSNSGWDYRSHVERRGKLNALAQERRHAWLMAWDPVRRHEVWRVEQPDIGSGGTLATAGNIVAQSSIKKTFAIHQADTGRKLWETDIQTVALAGPISYRVDGEQYIAVNAGWGGGRAIVARVTTGSIETAPARILAFKLGGEEVLPPFEETASLPPPPPPLTASETAVSKGAGLFAANCARCHGQEAIGGLKDLRFMAPETHANFKTIVLKGTLEDVGMAGFDDILSEEDVEAIHAYLIARANEDWGRTVQETDKTK